MTATLRFESFCVGQALGSSVQMVDRNLAEAWQRLYRASQPGSDSAPLGLLSVLMMRAYMAVVVPRPPGNIHAGQRLQALRPFHIDEPIAIALTCNEVILKRDRRLVRFGTVGMSTANGDTLFDGTITIFWAS